MLQECNKFREHQARELLIELLEQQLEERKKLVAELQDSIAKAEELLPDSVLKMEIPATGTTKTEQPIKSEEDATTIKAEAMEEGWTTVLYTPSK